ncbi:hypothetical protein [Metapseudomonas furukawaii]|uniref:Uncharacterized protein n=1 Tax=Metapseudomonas furukawaii TaxID=1149133 RepID=L8MNI7_METFU|nr:hypothetical protein [Pseudomonas furukawaii]ELS25356.1 hypothetical protein ppKF707_2259 [Pseudomonas furukawaii]ELS27568.1 hypothetical protein ppKF707_4940 [Pseudomonas furukawaii]BAU77439.1 hypothetical protein KF707C_p500 [Pseudomonas furukawaii]
MASRKNPLLNLDSEKLMDLLRVYRADDLRAEQRKLTTAGNQLAKLASGPMSALFSPEELASLQQTVALVRSVSQRVEHAKEIKARREEQQARERAEKEKAMHKALDERLPKGFDQPQQCIELVTLTLALQSYRVVFERRTAEEFGERLKQDIARQTAGGYSVQGVFNLLRHDVLQQLRDEMVYRSWDSAPDFVQEVFAKVEARQAEAARNNGQLIDYLQAQLQIEQSGNVERLPVKPKRNTEGRK